MAGRCGKQQESLTKLGEWAGKAEEPRENKVINLGREVKQMTVRKDIRLCMNCHRSPGECSWASSGCGEGGTRAQLFQPPPHRPLILYHWCFSKKWAEHLNMSSESQINILQQRLICKSKQTASLHFYWQLKMTAGGKLAANVKQKL